MLFEILQHILTQPDGGQILLGIVRRVVANTPTWVYALFIALTGFGLSQTRKRSVSEVVLAATPLGMLGWSLYSVIAAFGLPAAAVWAGGAIIAVSIGLVLKRPAGVRYVAQEKRFEIPGSWLPLGLILSVFAIRYLLAVAMGIDPSLRQSSEFIFVASLAYGLLGGLFPSRAARFWKARISA